MMYKYIVEFGGGAVDVKFSGNTVDELYNDIENDYMIQDWLKKALMFGYFNEFAIPSDMHTKQYTIDNCLWFSWTVKQEEEI